VSTILGQVAWPAKQARGLWKARQCPARTSYIDSTDHHTLLLSLLLHAVAPAGVQTVTVSCQGVPLTSVSVKATAVSGQQSCRSDSTGGVSTTFINKPVVAFLEGPATTELCENATQLSFAYTVSSGTSARRLTVVPTGPTGVTCTATPSTNGENGVSSG
jgi:hypothetical protein